MQGESTVTSPANSAKPIDSGEWDMALGFAQELLNGLLCLVVGSFANMVVAH